MKAWMRLLGVAAVCASLASCGEASPQLEGGPVVATAAPLPVAAEVQGGCSISWARLEHGAQACSGSYRLTFEVRNDGAVPIHDVEIDTADMGGLPIDQYRLSVWSTPDKPMGNWSCDAVSGNIAIASEPCKDTWALLGVAVPAGPVARLRFYDDERPIQPGETKAGFGVLIRPDNGRTGAFTFRVQCSDASGQIIATSQLYNLAGREPARP